MAKKIISLLLVAVLLIPALGVVSVTAGDGAPALSYTVTGSTYISEIMSVSDLLFSVSVSVDSSKVAALDGESKAYTYELKSLVANGVDYITDKEAFFDSFEADDFSGTNLEATVQIDFESDKVFGALDYTVNIVGFMEPLSIGMGSIDDALQNAPLPTDVSITGNVWQFPSVKDIDINSVPTKQDYLDNEKFDFSGTSVYVWTQVAVSSYEAPGASGAIETFYVYEDGYEGIVNYDSQTSNLFTSNPSKDEKLNVNATEVVAYFNGVRLATLPVKVDHAWSSDYVSITTDLYTDTKPGYHAIVCDGCGEAKDAQPHEPTPLTDENGEILVDENDEPLCWTFNNDQTFIKNGTESSVCQHCGAVLTRNVLGSADYNESLANYHFIRVILDYVNTLLRIIYGAIG